MNHSEGNRVGGNPPVPGRALDGDISRPREPDYILVRSGVLASVRIGRSVRIPERVLANFIESGVARWREQPPETDHAA